MPRIFTFIKTYGVLSASGYFTLVADMKGNIFLKCMICSSAAVISLTPVMPELSGSF